MDTERYAAEDLIGFKEAAQLAGVSRGTIRRWFEIGQLHGVRIGHSFFTTRLELKRAVEAMESSPLRARRLGDPSPELMAESEYVAI